MNYNVIQIHNHLTIPTINDRLNSPLKMRRSADQAKLQMLITPSSVLRHKTAVRYALWTHQHIVIARFYVKRAKTCRALQPPKAVVQVRSWEAVGMRPRVNSAEIGTKTVILPGL